MQTTNIWNMYHLSSKKVIIALVLLFVAGSVQAQQNMAKHDAKRENNGYSYGIHIGASSHNFRVEHSNTFLNQNEIMSVEGDNQTHLSIGIIGALHPSENIEVRAIPNLSFGNQNLIYYMRNLDKPVEYQGSSTVLELPLQVKYKSDGYKDFRMFVLGGGGFRTNFSTSKNEESDLQTVILEKSDVMLEIGGGAEFHFPFFVLAPQLSIKQGLNNQIKDQNTIYTNAIDKLNSRIYTLSINIE